MKRAYFLLFSVGMLLALHVPVCEGAESLELDGLIEPYMVVNVGSGVPGILETNRTLAELELQEA